MNLPAYVPERIAARVVVVRSGCWTWTGPTRHGYGRLTDQAGPTVHRLVWFASGRVIPAGHVLDHVCHDPATCRGGPRCVHRRCVNPDHLRAIPRGENTSAARRSDSFAARGACRRGHDVTDPAAVYVRPDGSRECRACRARARRAHRERGPPRPVVT